MWLLLLVVLAICVESGKAGVWIALIVGVTLLLSAVLSGIGMIWPWPRGKEWEDATADAGWRYLIHAREVAERWVLNRWGSKNAALWAGWIGLLIALLSACAALVFWAEVLFPQSSYPEKAASWLLGVLLFSSIGFFGYTVFKRKAPSVVRTKRAATEVIRDDLHGEVVLLSQWRVLCGSVPLPYSFWRYARGLLPVLGWAYHHFFSTGHTLALTAVVGVAMAYFAYVMVDLSFDVLAAVHGVEVCPCRSAFLARLVWESQFLVQRHKPLWAKFVSWMGI